MNNKKNIVFGVVVLVIGLVGGYFYFFVPTTAQYMSFDASGVASGTDVTVSDLDISSSTDVDAPIPVDNPNDTQDIVPKKTSKALSVKQNISSPAENDNSTPTIDDISSPGPENNSSSAIIPAASCSFPDEASSVPSRQIIFNEIAWMGSASSSGAEWMEIKNISAGTIDISGWELLSESGKIKISFSAGAAIPAGGFLLLSRNNSSTGISYSGDLSNTGEVLAIMDPQCAVSDLLDASSGWPAGNNKTKQTLERDDDGIGWHTSVLSGGTPDAENSFIAPANQAGPANNSALLSGDSDAEIVAPSSASATTTVSVSTPTTTASTSTNVDATSTSNSTSSSIPSGHVLIAAVQIAGASSTNDFIKLYNPTASSIDMSGWKLHKRSNTGTDYSLKTFPTGSLIAAGHSFMWANSTDGFSEEIGANISSTETLSADNSVALLDANGVIIDAVAWGTGSGQYGDGPPYPTDPAANQILTRQLVNGSMVDTSNNANDFILQ